MTGNTTSSLLDEDYDTESLFASSIEDFERSAAVDAAKIYSFCHRVGESLTDDDDSTTTTQSIRASCYYYCHAFTPAPPKKARPFYLDQHSRRVSTMIRDSVRVSGMQP